ncbi:MAG: transporter substrate-binding domain-containing protein [Pseudomonadota bacterium]
MQTGIAGLLLMLALGSAHGAPPEMTFIAPLNHMMPFADFQDGEMKGGLIKDIGEVLAHRMGYVARFHSVPSKRVAIALAHGEADGVCFVLPGWIDGEFNWTKPAIPGAGVIISHNTAPVLKSLQALANERVGTVLGYRYPQVVSVLGDTLRRDDAPSVQHSIAKLVAGRSRYAIIDQMTIEYYIKTHPGAPLRVDLVIEHYKASCVFSLLSPVKFAEVDRVLAGMVEDGTIAAILARYK